MTAVLQTDRLSWMILCTCAALWEETTSVGDETDWSRVIGGQRAGF